LLDQTVGDSLPRDEIFIRLPVYYHRIVLTIYQNLGGFGTGVVVGGHGKTIGPGAHHRDEVPP
jgi:hypothetical protein